ncbi:MAG: methionine--tRNA ligase [Blastocatellia bacterium]|nr:methionine--tRNA ligase [Blastocatellia bacterium]
MKTFYITTPIYYANSLPHLGHLYTTIVADVLHRYKEQRGFEVHFLTGTDEHGINIQRAADKVGRTPKEQVDHIAGELKKMFSEFGLGPESGGYDIFMRTTEPFHYEAAQNFWRKMAAGKSPKGRDNVYKGHYQGWFCAPCAAYKAEEEFYTPEGGDVPFCSVHERALDRVSEESYFFRLSDYEEFLLESIENNNDLVQPISRRNEVISFIKRGLQDLSISRESKSVAWGVPVPEDDGHVMYVWVDALSNYITALGYGSDYDDATGFEKFWGNAMHLVGKDILRFHTIYWFSFLKAAGLPLPQTVYAHGMWLDSAGRKMGKTLGNAIEVEVLHQHFQTDALRYFLLREMAFGQDGKFGYESLIERVNADLASGLGNLLSRTISMIDKYRGGKIPHGKIEEKNYLLARRAGIDPDGQDIVSTIEHARDEFVRRMDRYEFSLALETVWAVIAKTDKLISDSKPWVLAKDETQTETLNAVLYRSAETLRWLAVMLHPIMPESTGKIWRQLGLTGDAARFDPVDLAWGGLYAGSAIGEAEGIFPRIDRIKVMNEINVNKAEVGEQAPVAQAAEVTAADAAEGAEKDFIFIDDFLKVELRVGEIKVAERIPNADKLLRFEVDLGEEKPRQILAGLAEYYDPEKLIGRKVVVVANLKPRKMRGLESQGMICAASFTEEDSPAIATFLEDVSIGARLK